LSVIRTCLIEHPAVEKAAKPGILGECFELGINFQILEHLENLLKDRGVGVDLESCNKTFELIGE
jgi:hypothetical protein